MSPSLSTAEQITWERGCSRHITSDVIWNLDAYRTALYLLHCVQVDLETVRAREEVKDQLIRAAGAIGADLSEGYSRSTRADRVRYYGYALGSIRECVVWYLGLNGKLEGELIDARLAHISRCRALVLGMIKSARNDQPNRGRFQP
jgi:four helix bundle protein